jgi:hypothetical protein
MGEAYYRGTILRRPRSFVIRVNDREYADLRKRAKRVRLTLSEYARCKIFDVAFEQVGGVNPKRHRVPEAEKEPNA